MILRVRLPGSVTTVSQDTPLNPSGHVHWQLALTYPPFWHTGGDIQCATKVTTSYDILLKKKKENKTTILPFWHTDTIHIMLQNPLSKHLFQGDVKKSPDIITYLEFDLLINAW